MTESTDKLKVNGVGRAVDDGSPYSKRTLEVYFNRKPTDDELRAMHDLLRARLDAKPDVRSICDAYESGYGHGLKRDGLPSPYKDGTDEHLAYVLGYGEGEGAANAAKPAAVPEGQAGLPWHNPRRLLHAWTAETYEGAYPMYVNVTQVGSMVELTMRGPAKQDEPGDSITINVNVWTLNKLAEVLTDASRKFECGLETRIFLEHQKAATAAPEAQAASELLEEAGFKRKSSYREIPSDADNAEAGSEEAQPVAAPKEEHRG